MSATALANLASLGSFSSGTSNRTDANPERIAELAQLLAVKMRSAVEQIEAINVESRMLSLNAQIEAARSRAAGVTFGVVATAMRNLSGATSEVAKKVSSETSGVIEELKTISVVLANNVRGVRLTDLALMNIDLIDRNLYERSCDCRWWATDSSLVQALTERTPESYRYASRRMGVILNAYTVYFDLVLADLQGNIVANGRPDLYRSVTSNHVDAEWFRTARATRSGDEFGFGSLHESPLVNKQRALVYSAAVREGGDVTGKQIGVLGVVFKWDALAQTIVENTPLSDDERAKTRVCIIDKNSLVLADSADQSLRETLKFPGLLDIMETKKSFQTVVSQGKKYCMAHAKAPGFETYTTGWHSVIIQESSSE